MAIYSNITEDVSVTDNRMINQRVLREYSLTVSDPSNLMGNNRLFTKSLWDQTVHPDLSLRTAPSNSSQILRVCDLSKSGEPANSVANSVWTSYGLGNNEYPNCTCRLILFEDNYTDTGLGVSGLMHLKYLDYTDTYDYETYHEFYLRLQEFTRNHTFSTLYGNLNSAGGQSPLIPEGVYNYGAFPYWEHTFAIESNLSDYYLYNLTDNEGDKLTFWDNNGKGKIGCIIACQWPSYVEIGDSHFDNFKLWACWKNSSWSSYSKSQTLTYLMSGGGYNYASRTETVIDCSELTDLTVPSYNLGVYRDINPGKSYVGNSNVTGPVVIAFIPNFQLKNQYFCLFHTTM